MNAVSARPWTVEPGEMVRLLGSDEVSGLGADEVAARLARGGANELAQNGRRPAWLRLAAQYANTLSGVLAAAAVVTTVIGNVTDTAVIGAILLLDGVVGFIQEGRAERAVEALARMAADTCRVRRDGVVREVEAAGLVPGDMVLLEAGDVVPADVRLVEASGLLVQEAALTGEPEPMAKSVGAMDASEETILAERRCMAYKATSVVHGRALGVVTATGMATEIGRVAALVQSQRHTLTPLQVRLAVLGQRLALAAFAVCVAVFAAGVAAGEAIDRMFLTAVSLAVAAIPEGLPAVVTVALALGARRMAERRAIVRRLPAVESLGSVTVICSDKTGTLTQNRMVVERAWTPGGSYQVTGSGYAPLGEVVADQSGQAVHDLSSDRFLADAALVATACNDAALQPPPLPTGDWGVVGDPTEGALLAFAGKLGVDGVQLAGHRPRRAELGFDPSRRRMTTFHADGEEIWVATKGALTAIAPLLDPEDSELATEAATVARQWAAEGLRVLALAQRRREAIPDVLDAGEADLRLLGLVAMTDPPRSDVGPAIRACRQAGITPVMITGDDSLTAVAIAQRIGISEDDNVLSGAELEALKDDELAQRVPCTSVYARTTPEQKLRIVAGWKAHDAVVAMTGDGVNDAPALRLADIGVAMGIMGTDVSKEAADMVLADDDFATIVGAVEEGRRIYDNIRRFVRYLLTTNTAEVLVMFLAPVLLLPLPLLPVQILWVNLVTDGPPAIALGLEPAEPGVLSRPPRPPQESVLGGGLWRNALGIGLAMAAVTIAVQVVARAVGWDWRTMVFSVLALMQLGNALAMRSRNPGAGRLGLRSNPWLVLAVVGVACAQLALLYAPPLRTLFHTGPLGPGELAVVVAASSSGYWIAEGARWLTHRTARGHAGRPS